MTSQLGYLIILGTETRDNKSFTLIGNIIYYSLIKSKRVIRSILALEIYRIVSGVNSAYTFNTTLN